MATRAIEMVGRYCVRVYNNGEMKACMRDEAGLESWVSYNNTFRGGCALFVDGRCIQAGYLDDDRVYQVCAELARRGVPDWEPEVKGPRRERWGVSVGAVDEWFGYPAEREVPRIRWDT